MNIAVELLADAFQDNFDTALVVSADSDLAPPIVKIRNLFSEKRVVAVFPPARASRQLAKVAHASMVVGKGKLSASQLPDRVTKRDGFVLKRPESWS